MGDKICKYGADPLYQDSFQTIRYSNWTYSIYTTNSGVTVTGNYSVVFTDSAGEDWSTTAIDIAATCTDVVNALEAIPNSVIPAGTATCHKWAADSLVNSVSTYEPVDTQASYMHAKFTLAFQKNPGMLKDLQINTHLDGSRTTLYTDESTSTLNWYIFTNGFYGENDDMVPDVCTGVTVTLAEGANSAADVYDVLSGLSAAETILLKKCLGDADGDSTNNE